jgi:hypothetical protein
MANIASEFLEIIADSAAEIEVEAESAIADAAEKIGDGKLFTTDEEKTIDARQGGGVIQSRSPSNILKQQLNKFLLDNKDSIISLRTDGVKRGLLTGKFFPTDEDVAKALQQNARAGAIRFYNRLSPSEKELIADLDSDDFDLIVDAAISKLRVFLLNKETTIEKLLFTV